MAEPVARACLLPAIARPFLTEDTELAKLRTLKHGLMDDLLTGRVRVTSMQEA